MAGFRAVIFDLDGLLLDSEPVYKRAWQRAAEEGGRSLDDVLYARLIGRTNPDCESILRREFGERFDIDRFRQRWRERWRDDVEQNGVPHKPGVDALLSWLDERGVAKAVATSSERGDAELSLHCSGLSGRFDELVTGDEIEEGKPAPDIFLAAARRLGVDPGKCVAFEDSEPGALAADAAGMRVIVVPDLNAPSKRTRGVAWHVIPSLDGAVTLLS